MLFTKLQWGSMAVVGTAVIALIGSSFASIGEAQDAAGSTEPVRSLAVNPADERDEAYIRRLSKELRGCEPTPAEIYLFVSLKDAQKRVRLVKLFAKEMEARENNYRELIEKKRAELERITRALEVEQATLQQKKGEAERDLARGMNQAMNQLAPPQKPEATLAEYFNLIKIPDTLRKPEAILEGFKKGILTRQEAQRQFDEARRILSRQMEVLKLQAEELSRLNVGNFGGGGGTKTVDKNTGGSADTKDKNTGGSADTKPNASSPPREGIIDTDVAKKQAEAERQARIAAMQENKAMQEMHRAMVEQFEALRREQKELIQAQKAELEALRQKQLKDLERLKELERKLTGVEKKPTPGSGTKGPVAPQGPGD